MAQVMQWGPHGNVALRPSDAPVDGLHRRCHWEPTPVPDRDLAAFAVLRAWAGRDRLVLRKLVVPWITAVAVTSTPWW